MRAFHRHLALMSWSVLLVVVLLHSLISWQLMAMAGEEKLVELTAWFYYYIVTATTIGYGDRPGSLGGHTLAAAWRRDPVRHVHWQGHDRTDRHLEA
jgi:hypothetical protein